MGVHQLWRLLDGFSSSTTIAQWSGRVIAVDASVWMAQFREAQRRRGFAGGGSMLNGFEDGVEDGSQQRLLGGFLSRILKLIYYNITPIFVFDGPSSASKVHEVRRRSGIRLRRERESVVRRAKRILDAQVSAGIITKSTLAQLPLTIRAPRPTSCGSPRGVSPKKSTRSDDTPTKRFVRRRRARDRVVVLAPDAVSRANLSTFVKESALFVDERNTGAAIAAANTLQTGSSFSFTRSSSLFLGARSALEADSTASSSSLKPSAANCDTPLLNGRRNLELESARAAHGATGAQCDRVEADSDCLVVPRIKPRWVPLCDAARVAVEVDDVWNENALPHGCSQQATPATSHATSLSRQPSVPATVSASTRSNTPKEDAIAVDSTEDEAEEGDDDFVAVFVRPELQLPSNAPAVVALPEDSDETSNSVTFIDAPLAQPNPLPLPVTDRLLRPCRGSTAAAGGGIGDSSPTVTKRLATEDRIRPKHVEVQVVPFELVDLVELLRLCDVRFVVSPSEADAQCAYLSKIGVVDGIFTEDSDVVVHGATVVLRGFFTQPHVVATSQAALREAGITKGVLLALSQLLGCDYTAGAALGICDALDVLACARGPLFYGPFVPPESDDDALLWAHDTIRTWTQLLKTDPESWPLDLSIAQRTAAMHRVATRWLKMGCVLQSKEELDDAGRESCLSEALQSLPNTECLKLFTENVPLNRGVNRRPTAPDPDWPAIKRFAQSRGLADLAFKVDLTAKEVERRRAATKPAHEEGRSRLDPRQRTLDNVVIWRALPAEQEARPVPHHAAPTEAVPQPSPNMDGRQRAIGAALSWLRNSRGVF